MVISTDFIIPLAMYNENSNSLILLDEIKKFLSSNEILLSLDH